MQTIGIKDLQINPTILTKILENKDYAIITKRSSPIGIAVALDEQIISMGLKTSLLIDSYKSGKISLGQLSKAMNISKQKAMKLLSLMKIDIIEYDFQDDMRTLDSFLW